MCSPADGCLECENISGECTRCAEGMVRGSAAAFPWCGQCAYTPLGLLQAVPWKAGERHPFASWKAGEGQLFTSCSPPVRHLPAGRHAGWHMPALHAFCWRWLVRLRCRLPAALGRGPTFASIAAWRHLPTPLDATLPPNPHVAMSATATQTGYSECASSFRLDQKALQCVR